jgi:beta-glucanase (GH16 family)
LASRILTATAAADTFAFKHGGASTQINSFAVGVDRLSFTTEGGYKPWTREVTEGGAAGTKVIYGWAPDDYVFLPGVRNVPVETLLNPETAPPPSATVPAPAPQPGPGDGGGSQTIGAGSDSLVLRISQDAYQGNAQYTISVDGKQIGGVLTARALHSAGASDTVTVKGEWAAGPHSVSVRFLNDAWGGSSAADRNLHVDGISYNGAEVAAASARLGVTGSKSFSFTEAASPPPPPSETKAKTIGTGSDTLVLKVSQDAYQGDAQFVVRVDGKQIGGTQSVKSLHDSGLSDTLTIKGDWSAGAHRVEVQFLNDAWGGSADKDRNLHIDGASYNGKAVSGVAFEISTAISKSFSFNEAAPPAPMPEPPSVVEPPPVVEQPAAAAPEAVNVLVRGQSNAIYLMEGGNWAGLSKLQQEIQRLLGFDGVKQQVNIVFDRYDAASSTAFGGTSLIGDWLSPKNGDWKQGWTANSQEKSLLAEIGQLSAAQKAQPAAVVWLHSEYDSTRSNLTPEEWMSAVRHDAGLVRQAWGKSAADLPYLFVDAHPYWGTEQGHQAIRQGMERLSKDGSFNADVAARALDLDLDRDNMDGNSFTREYGGPHISDSDALILAGRIARSVAEEFAEYARPGSPVSQAGGNIDDHGPQVVAAETVGARQLRLTVTHDQAASFAALDPDAAKGVGWSVRDGSKVVEATSVKIVDGAHLLVTFGADVPVNGKLFYGYGYGRLEGADGTGQGNAVYDNQGMPIWVSADGLKIGAGTTAPSTPTTPVPAPAPGNLTLNGTAGANTLTGGAGADTITGSAGNDHLTGGAGKDTFVFRTGDGSDTVTDFKVGEDKLSFTTQFGYQPWVQEKTVDGAAGTLVRYDWNEADAVFLSGVTGVKVEVLLNPTAAASSTPTTPAPTPADSSEFGKLVFSDEFSGSSVDRSKWTTVYGGSTYWNGAFEWDNSQLSVSGGSLHIGMEKQASGMWSVGGLSSTPNQWNPGNSLLYGKVEIAAKVSQEVWGAGPCFLLWPSSNDHWPPEVDILETPKGKGMFTNHWQGPGGNNDDEYASHIFDLDYSQYHVYGLEWTPDRLTMTVDGKAVKTFTDHIPHERMSVGLQGHVGTANDGWYGSPNGTGVNSVDIAVDYVRVYDWIG